jgi:hypothetical protein
MSKSWETCSFNIKFQIATTSGDKVSPRLHTHTKRKLRFPPLPHTSYIRDCRSAPLSRDVFSGCSPVRGPVTALDFIPLRDSILNSRRERNKFPSLSLSTDKAPPHCHKLDEHPDFYMFSYILSREPQGRFRSNKLVRSSPPDSPLPVYSHVPRMSGNPKHSQKMPGGNVIQNLSAQFYRL